MLVTIGNNRYLVERAKPEFIQHSSRKIRDRNDTSRSFRQDRQDGPVINAKGGTVAFRRQVSIQVVDTYDMVGRYYGSNITEAQQNTPRQNWQDALCPRRTTYAAESWLNTDRMEIKAVSARGRDDDLGRKGSTPLLVLEEIIQRRNNLAAISL